MFEENFEEMQWALEELKTNYILLKAYTSLKEDLKKAYTEKDLKICEKLLRDNAEQFTDCYNDNLKIIL